MEKEVLMPKNWRVIGFILPSSALTSVTLASDSGIGTKSKGWKYIF